jgi:hypothetical protein|tara:strand:+ start:7646 stop:8038 length:393 start_codon:yes stop_codon:yes gene_type:complete
MYAKPKKKTRAKYKNKTVTERSNGDLIKPFREMSSSELISFCDASHGNLGALVWALVARLREPPEAMTAPKLVQALSGVLKASNTEQLAAAKLQAKKKEADSKLSAEARKTLHQLVNNHPLLILGHKNDL